MSLNDPQSASAILEAPPEEVPEAAAEQAAPEPAETITAEPYNPKLTLRLESIPGFDRHARKCQICHHPDMDDIEEEYVSWTATDDIRKSFKLKGESTIYRHARATGLDLRRRENLAVVLEKVLQEIDNTETPTVSEILRAARILARLNSRGQWVFSKAIPSEWPKTLTSTTLTTEGQEGPPVTNDALSGHGFLPRGTKGSRAESAGNSGVSTPEVSRMASDSRRIVRESSSLQPPASSLQNSNRQSEAPMKN